MLKTALHITEVSAVVTSHLLQYPSDVDVGQVQLPIGQPGSGSSWLMSSQAAGLAEYQSVMLPVAVRDKAFFVVASSLKTLSYTTGYLTSCCKNGPYARVTIVMTAHIEANGLMLREQSRTSAPHGPLVALSKVCMSDSSRLSMNQTHLSCPRVPATAKSKDDLAAVDKTEIKAFKVMLYGNWGVSLPL